MTLQEAKDQVANGKGYSNWKAFVLNEIHNYATTTFWDFLDEAAELYAASQRTVSPEPLKDLQAKVDFYRTETAKLREYVEEKKIGLPNQKLFDALYDYIKELEAKVKMDQNL